MTIADMRLALGVGDEVSDLDVVEQYAALNGDPAAFAPTPVVIVAPPPSPEEVALAAIRAAFSHPEPIVYRIDDADLPPFPAIKSDDPARDTSGTGGANLRRVFWEIEQSALPRRPRNGDTFSHAGRRWKVIQVEARDDVGAWEVTVTDAGPA